MIAKNFILVMAFIITFVILVHTQSPHVSLSSYQYDSNSISQNENILQLFLRLASYTAGKLHLLKHKILQQQLHDLKENEKIAKASQSNLNIKNMIETFLRLSSASITPTQNPLKSNLYQQKNPVAQNNFQSSGIKSASDEISTNSKEIPEASGNFLEVEKRMMVDYDKHYNASHSKGPNILNFGPISPRINLGTDSESSNKNGSYSSNGESSNKQQNSNPNNRQSSNSNNQERSNQHLSGNNQVGQDPGSIITMFNPAKLANVNPMNMVSNVPVIGSGFAGPINTVQESFSKFRSFAPQLRALQDIENDTIFPVSENLVEENQTSENSSQNPTTNGNTYSSPDNMFVNKDTSSMDQNKTNDMVGVTAESTLIFDNEITTNSNHLDEVSPNGNKSNLSDQNSAETSSLKEEVQSADQIYDKIKGEIQKEKKVEDLELSNESSKQNSAERNPPKEEIQRVDKINDKIKGEIQNEKKIKDLELPRESSKQNSVETNPPKEEIQRVDKINDKIKDEIEKDEKDEELELHKEILKQNDAETNPPKEEIQRVEKINDKIKDEIEKDEKHEDSELHKEILKQNDADTNPLSEEIQRVDKINDKINGNIEKEEKVEEVELTKESFNQNSTDTYPLKEEIQRVDKINHKANGNIEKEEKVEELELPKGSFNWNSAKTNPLMAENQTADQINNKINGKIENDEKVEELELHKEILKQNDAETNPLREEIQRVDKIKGKIEEEEKFDDLELPKESLKQTKENKHRPDYQDMQLKRLTIQLMKALRDMQNKIDHRAKHKGLQRFTDLRSEELVQKVHIQNVKAQSTLGENTYDNGGQIRNT